MENRRLGKGVFVPRGKKLPKGTFIPSSGIIKLDPTEEELATKVHCSALQDFNSPTQEIYGFIDPAQKGGILNFINHAPDQHEMANFNFKNAAVKKTVAASNLKSIIKFYNGYAIMGLEVPEDIKGGDYGVQLLWSYARSAEYIKHDESISDNPVLALFDNRDEHNGEMIDSSQYTLRKISICIDDGTLKAHKVLSLTRWELMEEAPDSGPLLSMNVCLSHQTEAKQLLIERKTLQAYLKQNPTADRIILDIKSS